MSLRDARRGTRLASTRAEESVSQADGDDAGTVHDCNATGTWGGINMPDADTEDEDEVDGPAATLNDDA